MNVAVCSRREETLDEARSLYQPSTWRVEVSEEMVDVSCYDANQFYDWNAARQQDVESDESPGKIHSLEADEEETCGFFRELLGPIVDDGEEKCVSQNDKPKVGTHTE
jgi:hypothetical protein